jgi:hypothetical protein
MDVVQSLVISLADRWRSMQWGNNLDSGTPGNVPLMATQHICSDGGFQTQR